MTFYINAAGNRDKHYKKLKQSGKETDFEKRFEKHHHFTFKKKCRISKQSQRTLANSEVGMFSKGGNKLKCH